MVSLSISTNENEKKLRKSRKRERERAERNPNEFTKRALRCVFEGRKKNTNQQSDLSTTTTKTKLHKKIEKEEH